MSWKEVFDQIKIKIYYKELMEFLDEEYKNGVVYPPRELLFRAFELTPLEQVRVVILGQDPYHEPNQAHGLAFSVPDGIELPPSLKNIYKEIENEFNIEFNNRSGDLTYLCKQGVLLLNPVLSVREHEPNSHKIKQYELLILDVLKALDESNNHIVFLLWGNNAKKYSKYIINKNHLILCATHPSPLGANKGGWFGSNIFIKTNEFLENNKEKPIIWWK